MSPRARAGLIDAVTVLATFVVLGLLGAVIWDKVVSLPMFTRTARGGVMDQIELAKIVGIDGWFFTIAALGGLAGGTGLMLARRASEPLLIVVLVLCGGVLASWLMLTVGLHLGPADPGPALKVAKDGASVPVQLRPKAHGVEFAWPLGAVFGALMVLLIVNPHPQTTTRSDEDAVTAG